MIQKKVEIFVSYTHEDEILWKQLEKHLVILQNQGFINTWNHRDISAGADWKKDIDTHLDAAQIILSLVSADFLSSDYFYSIEMKRAMERHESGKARVIPILLRPIHLSKAPFNKLKILPSNAKSITSWSNQDEAYVNVVKGIQDAVEELLNLVANGSLIDNYYIPDQRILRCPYRGLYTFREQDTAFFHGREGFIDQLIISIQEKPLVAVIGPSGCGKSSVIYAGLIPRLRAEKDWLIISFRPGDHPFSFLAAALSETMPLMRTDNLIQQIQGKYSLCEIVKYIAQKQQITKFLLFIDQFEELYTLCRHIEERQLFLDSILEAAQKSYSSSTIRLVVVITLRSDFLSQALAYRPFTDALQHADLKLSTMNRQELKDVIRKPIEKLNVFIENGLTERILDALNQESGNLPLLEFTLTQLWEKQQNAVLTHQAYDEMGGVNRSLATYAEKVYADLDQEEQEQIRKIFIQLVQFGDGTEDTRRRTVRSQLGEENWNLVTRLSRARLVVCNRNDFTGEETVELVHEALIKGWFRFCEWIGKDREFRLWQERLRIRMREWVRTKYSSSELLRGVVLREAEKWNLERSSELNQNEKDFINLSVEQRSREKYLEDLHRIQTDFTPHPVSKSTKKPLFNELEYIVQTVNKRQNDPEMRLKEYLSLLQKISVAFPTSVLLSDLLESMCTFTMQVVDTSSMLITFYDRDFDRIYDVFAVVNGRRVSGLAENPLITHRGNRPIWWQVLQTEKHPLHFSPAHDTAKAKVYGELLGGSWGQQHYAEAFLLLPMKMFNRVLGSVSITSMYAEAFQLEEIQVLETMLQIVAGSIENTKLYERDRHILHEARQREAQLAAVNSALQSISSVLSVTELISNLVESVANIAETDSCAFFELSPTQDVLFANAVYMPSRVKMVDANSSIPIVHPYEKGELKEAIIQLPFKGTFLEQMKDEGFFYLEPNQLEELAQQSNDEGAVFLRETGIEYMLVVPMSYQTQFMGFLAVPIPHGRYSFRPKVIGILLAICAQAVSAMRNAQLYKQREEAYVELQRTHTLLQQSTMSSTLNSSHTDT